MTAGPHASICEEVELALPHVAAGAISTSAGVSPPPGARLAWRPGEPFARSVPGCGALGARPRRHRRPAAWPPGEGRFFHGYYYCYCYLPLYIFCGDRLLAAKLRRADIDASAGATDEVARIVARIRERWPAVEIVLRADLGFAREGLMA